MRDAGYGRPAVIVIGAGEIGSAIAVALHRANCAVVITDEIDPAWPRRGMSFTNAWYIGNAELDGEAAVFCASLRSIPSVLHRRGAIAATSWSRGSIAASLEPIAIVDATLRAERLGRSAADNPHGALTIAILAPSGDASGVDIAVPLPPELDQTSAPALAPRNGRFSTNRRIGDRVASGDILGGVASVPITAPCAGALLGLSARGAFIREGSPIAEVDPRNDPIRCFCLDRRGTAVARGVLHAMAQHGSLAWEAIAPASDGLTTAV